jgi:hypothetical protein
MIRILRQSSVANEHRTKKKPNNKYVNCITRGSPNAQRQQVGSEKGDQEAQGKVGSQAGGEIEETEDRDEKGSCCQTDAGCQHPAVAHDSATRYGGVSVSRGRSAAALCDGSATETGLPGNPSLR